MAKEAEVADAPAEELEVMPVSEPPAPDPEIGSEYDAPERFGNEWHTYAPKARAYIKHVGETVHAHIVGSGSVQVLDEQEFLQDWEPNAEQRPAEHVA